MVRFLLDKFTNDTEKFSDRNFGMHLDISSRTYNDIQHTSALADTDFS